MAALSPPPVLRALRRQNGHVFGHTHGVLVIALRRHYLNTWFALDLCSLLPSTFDMLPYALESPIREETIAAGADSSDADVLRRFKFLRVLRCFRLIKLMRLLRASRLVARWETRISVSYASLSLCKMLVAYLLLAHWSACLLVLPTTFYDNRASTWLGSFGYCVAQTPGEGGFAGGADAAFPSTHPSDDPCYRFINLARGLHADHALSDELLASGTCTVHCDSPERIYVASIYLTLQLICGATGGVLDREKFNVQEQLLLALLAAFGALLWGQVIGTFVSVIANARPDVTWFRSAMDQLNGFMALYELPGQMRFRLREYFQQSRHVQRGLQRKRILDHLSPQLQGEVAMHMNQRWLEGIRFLRGAEPEMVVLVACSLVPAVFTPGELTTPGHLYTIQKGIALYSGRLLTTGRCWGQDMILARQHLCHFTARAMSYLEVYRLSRATLLDLARPFPVALRRIRWEALRLAMLRVMILTKRQLERQREVEARRKRKEGVRVVLHEASDCTPPEAEVARPAAPPEGGTERAATDPPERVWETFLELATETPKTAIKGGSFSFKAKAPDAMEHLVVDPAAVMEVPSLHDLSHGLTHMRGEMEELKAGIGKILERLGGAAPTTSGADPASAHSAPAPAATRLLFA